MHLSAHLTIVGTTYYFRLTTPPDLMPIVGKRYLKHSLKTNDPQQAKALAYALHSAYLEKFRGLRAMNRDPKEEAERLKGSHSFLDGIFKKGGGANPSHLGKDATESTPEPNISKFDVDAVQLPDGTYHWDTIKTDGTEKDKADGEAKAEKLNAMKAIPSWAGKITPALPKSELLSVCRDWFLVTYKSKVAKETLDKYKFTLNEFLTLHGDCEVNTIIRVHISKYKEFLMAEDEDEKKEANSITTIKNKLSELGTFFKELIRAGKYQGINPAEQQVKYSTDEKKIRSRLFGKKSFKTEQVEMIFNADNYKINKEPAEYWVPLVQLYTGARINEVCQLLVSDFVFIDKYECFVIVDEELEKLIQTYKSTKEESSRRIIPLHPDLLKLGFWEYVQLVKSYKHEMLFPYLSYTGNRFAGRQTRAFTAYLTKLGIDTENGRVGTHAFRKFLIQHLQRNKVDKDLRKIYVGHSKDDTLKEAFDVHTDVYEYEKRAKEVVEGIFPYLNFDIDLEKLKKPMDSFREFLAPEYIADEHAKTVRRQKTSLFLAETKKTAK